MKLETRDYKNGILIDAGQARYLEGGPLIPKGSMAPFLLAFSQIEIAESYQRKHGGNIVDYHKAMEIVRQFDEEVSSGE